MYADSAPRLIRRQGARINGASTALTIDEIAYALKVAKTKVVVTARSSLEKVRQAALLVGISPDNVLLIKGQHHENKAIQDLIELGISLPSFPPHRLPAGNTNKEVCGFLNFSSGTTGLPKPVSSTEFAERSTDLPGYALAP